MGERKVGYRFLVGKMTERDILENLGVDGRIISKYIFKKVGWKDVDCTDLEQCWRKWRAVVHAVINLRFP